MFFVHIFRVIYGWKSWAARRGSVRSNVMQFLYCCCPLIYRFLAKSYVSRVFGPFLDKSPVCKRRNREIGRYGIPTWLLSVLTCVLYVQYYQYHASKFTPQGDFSWQENGQFSSIYATFWCILMRPSMNSDVDKQNILATAMAKIFCFVIISTKTETKGGWKISLRYFSKTFLQVYFLLRTDRAYLRVARCVLPLMIWWSTLIANL